MATVDHDPDSAIRVSVLPSQSSYFAGEPFSVSITFTNTRTPNVTTSSSSASGAGAASHVAGGVAAVKRTHKRGAHSVSSAPLARPPTSPVTPRTAVPILSTSTSASIAGLASDGGRDGGKVRKVRKGLVGASAGAGVGSVMSARGEEMGERQRMKKGPSRSLSVVLSPQDVSSIVDPLSTPSPSSSLSSSATSSTATIVASTGKSTGTTPPGTLSRTAALALSPAHPHARKQSVPMFDTTAPSPASPSPYTPSPLSASSRPQTPSVQLHSIPPSPTSSPSPFPPSASASTSAFSLSLDPISEGSTEGYHHPSISSSKSESTTTTSTTMPQQETTHSYPPKPPPRRTMPYPPNLSLGHPPPPHLPSHLSPHLQLPPHPHTSHPTTTTFPHLTPTPNTELILYAYANLSCSLVVAPPPVPSTSNSYAGSFTSSSAPSVQSYSASLANLRGKLLRRGGVLGGGSMDISASLSSGSLSSTSQAALTRRPSKRTLSHSRASSISSSIMSLLSPSTSAPSLSSTSSSSPSPGTKDGWTPGHKQRSPSLFGIGSFLSPNPSAGGGGLSPSSSSIVGGVNGVGALGMTGGEDIDPETPLPVFDVQPSMLAVDLALLPGESRTYTYTLPLPSNLPPTFKGRALKFSYTLVVGVCRAGSLQVPSSSASFSSANAKPNSSSLSPYTPSPSNPTTPPVGTTTVARKGSGGSRGSTSRVMRVPIRVYNHVDVAGLQRPYDLLFPVTNGAVYTNTLPIVTEVVGGRHGSGASVKTKAIGASPSGAQKRSQQKSKSDSVDGLREYATKLLAAYPDPLRFDDGSGGGAGAGGAKEERGEDDGGQSGGRGSSWGMKSPMELSREKEADRPGREAGELTGCREAVEILTRNLKKVSYDVNKDGVRVAVLTFVKSAYRLGETVLGVVELNSRSSRARVLKLSAMLEAHESLPSSLTSSSTPSQLASLSKHLKKVHAEHHSSLVPSTLRTTFALDIPSDASPAFGCVVGSGASSPLSHGSTQTQRPGGLEWKVRLCLLVAVASPQAREGFDGIRVKQMVRDGTRGEWGSAWVATKGIAPLQKVETRRPLPSTSTSTFGASSSSTATSQTAAKPPAPPPPTTPQGARGWASYLFSSLLMPGGEREYHDGDEDEDDYGFYEGSEDSPQGTNPPTLPSSTPHAGNGNGTVGEYAKAGLLDEYGEVDFGGGEEGWEDVKVETVECEVPISVWPGNTAYCPLEVVFEL
ncbi:Rgp1-domain-containing protein [Rickenella mellea]|uniref:Rgp1-domain-containing protein n=1 Tax=Rickenella mellea TaxID=50990 RepID=A0A4Y7Q4Y1_9AGAM|nr:Rgp1-domain-containing protein [Rickenella mellea]